MMKTLRVSGLRNRKGVLERIPALDLYTGKPWGIYLEKKLPTELDHMVEFNVVTTFVPGRATRAITSALRDVLNDPDSNLNMTERTVNKLKSFPYRNAVKDVMKGNDVKPFEDYVSDRVRTRSQRARMNDVREAVSVAWNEGVKVNLECRSNDVPRLGRTVDELDEFFARLDGRAADISGDADDEENE